jgi:hypothetical protein
MLVHDHNGFHPLRYENCILGVNLYEHAQEYSVNILALYGPLRPEFVRIVGRFLITTLNPLIYPA